MWETIIHVPHIIQFYISFDYNFSFKELIAVNLGILLSQISALADFYPIGI